MATILFALLSWGVITLLRLAGYFFWVNLLGPATMQSIWLQLLPQFIIVGLFSYKLVKVFYLEKPRFWLAVGLQWAVFTVIFEVGGIHSLVDVSTVALLENLILLFDAPWAVTYLLYLLLIPGAAYLVFRTTQEQVPTAQY
ncbi:MAG: hypothetical protein Kow0077_11710 [Anaerolineae bacterium]